MKVLVTGGAGFIGSHLFIALHKRGHDVRVFDRGGPESTEVGAYLKSWSNKNGPVEIYHHNFSKKPYVQRAVKNFKPDVVCHFGADRSVSASVRTPSSEIKNNLFGAINFAESCARHNARLIFASSEDVYGDYKTAAFKESDPVQPSTPYGISKISVERYLEFYGQNKGLNYQVLRMSSVYGPRDYKRYGENSYVGEYNHLASTGGILEIPGAFKKGDDGCIRDYIYVDDVVGATVMAVEGKVQEKVLNCCTGYGTSLRELSDLIIKNYSGSCNIVGKPPKKHEAPRVVLDPTLFRNYISPTTLDVGLRKTADWFHQGCP